MGDQRQLEFPYTLSCRRYQIALLRQVPGTIERPEGDGGAGTVSETELEATSRKYGVTAATLTGWRQAFLQGGEDRLNIRTAGGIDEEKKTLKSDERSVAQRVSP